MLGKFLQSLLILILFMGMNKAPLASASTGRDLLKTTPDFQNQPKSSQTGPHQATSLISSNESGVSFEIQVPWQELEQEIITFDGHDYMQLSISGWETSTQPRHPALPFLKEQIGVPHDAQLSIQVTPGKAHTISLPTLVLPAISQKFGQELPDPAAEDQFPNLEYVLKPDPSVYDSQQAYPGTLASLSSDGQLRQQRIASVSAFPVQYQPATRQITIYESLTVQVLFSGQIQRAVQQPPEESEIFENSLSQQLLNYDSAKQWRGFSEDSVSISQTSLYQVDRLDTAENSPWSPPSPGWRVKVRSDGIYQISYAELSSAGLPVTSLDPRSFQLFNMGSEVAIYVEGESDQIFNESDYILFYGQDISSKYTSDNVYWLTYDKTSRGLRMASQDGTPGTAPTPTFYPAQRHFEGSAYYLSKLPGDQLTENWLWDYLYPPTVRPTWSYNFSLAAPYSGPATLKLSLLGHVYSTSLNPDHHVRVSLNGIQIGETYWDGFTWQNLNLAIPQGTLLSGTNTLQLTALIDTGVTYDIIYIDWFELDFPNTFTAENNSLAFTYPQSGTWKFQLDSFSSDQLSVFDVSQPASPGKMDNLSVTASGSTFSVSFQDVLSTPSDYWAGSTYQSVQAIELDNPSNLLTISNAADYIIITHQDFTAQAESLRAYRAAQDLRSVAVDVQDIYDQFAYGITAPTAIHDFLAYAYASWQEPAPSYVLLLGDGHYDPKNYKSYNRTSYLPPFLLPVDPWIGETAADNRYVNLVGDDLMPDMMLGRLPANSPTEAASMISKIIAYEQTPPAGDWQQQVLAVADDTDSAGNFASISDNQLSCCLPDSYNVQKIYYGVAPYTDIAATRTAILSAISSGKLIVNYNGHGFTTGWAGEALITTASIPSLTNGGMQPVVLSMTCMDGYFQNPHPYTSNKEALGEVFARADSKGAIASWSPTGYGVASGHDYLNRGFFNAVFYNGATTVGEATLAGKFNLWSAGVSPDLLDTYILFGDPALRLPNAVKAVDDTYQTNEDVTLNVPAPGVLANDIGNEPLTAVWVSDPSNGSLTLNTDGSFQYVPNPDFYGVDSFTYKFWDGIKYSNIAKVTITVDAVNDAPVAVDDAFEIYQDTQLIVAASALAANDTDVDNAVLIVTAVSNPTNGAVNLASGTITFTPTSGFSGTAGFDYTVSDGLLSDIGHVVVTVNAIATNQPPVVSDIPSQTIPEGSTFTSINLDIYVSDADNTDTEMTWTYSGNSDLSVSIVNRVATINIPNINWNGSETITFRATDPGLSFDEDAATFTVTAVNDPPVVSDIPGQTISEGSTFAAISLDNFVTDVDNADADLIWTHSGNSQLSVSIVDRVATINIPNADWNGSETITFRATDPGSLFNEDAATFTVTAVNDPPVVSDIPGQTIAEGSNFTTINLDNYVSDVDNTDAEITWSYLGNTELIVNIVNRVATISTPDISWVGSETITFKATDPGSLFDEDAATFTVTEGVKYPPVISDIPGQTIPEGSSFVSISLDNYVSDLDHSDEDMIWSYSGNSDLTVSIIDRVATITVPNTNWNGSESITFRATDPDAMFDEDTATFTVTAVNDPPVVSGIPDQTISEGSSFTAISLDGFVTDIDNLDADLTWSYSGNSDLSVSIIDRVATISVPNLNWNGSETITFRATDPDGLYDQDAAVFSVTAVNDAPVNATPGSQAILVNEALVFEGAALISISDADVAETPGAMLQVTLSFNHGVLSLSRLTGLVFTNGDGTADASMTFMGSLSDINAALDGMVYTPALDYSGGDLLTITSNDLGYTGEGNALSDTDSVSILVSEFYKLYVPMLIK